MATVLIPAKGNSSRVPGKNMIDLAGHPLIWWTLQACNAWDVVTDVVVATDLNEIAEFAMENGATGIYSLDIEDIEDRRTATQLWKSFAEQVNGDHILMLATSPFRAVEEMQRAWTLYQTGRFDVVRSVSEQRDLFLDANGKPSDREFASTLTCLSQDREPRYKVCGGYCISNADYIRTCNTLYDGRFGMSVTSKVSAIDIDTPEDLEIARSLALRLTCFKMYGHFALTN